MSRAGSLPGTHGAGCIGQGSSARSALRARHLPRMRAVLASMLVAAAAQAAEPSGFPVRPMRMLVGFVPGGFTDIAGRMAGQGLTEAFGVQVIVDNRPGANGAVAAALTARAAADGYTFYMASPGHVTNPILQSQTRHHPVKDFTALAAFADIPNVLVVTVGLPAQNMQEFLALARTRQTTPLTQATTGIGSPGHLIGELLQLLAGVKFAHIPYKGSGPVMPDLASGRVDFSFPSAASALPHVQAGRIRALGMASPRRSLAYPEVPTIAEAGVPGFEVVGRYGVYGPARMPRDVTARLSAEIVRVARRNDIQAKLLQIGAEPAVVDSTDFAAFTAADYEKWLKVIKAGKITGE